MEDIDNTYVIDASVILAAQLPDEIFNKTANTILEYYRLKKIQLISPSLLTYEFLNSVRSALVQKRITETVAYKLIELFNKLEISLIAPDKKNVLKTALLYNLSVYDAAYVSLAILQQKPLITADKKLYGKLKGKLPFIKFITDFK